MTPIERLRKELLEKMGLTEDSLAQMPEEQRAAIEEEIRRAIKERLGIDDTQHAGAMEGQSTAGTPEAEA
jgi:TPP-dependent pyruvate/acetoin dehydrogenase alpha subunit